MSYKRISPIPIAEGGTNATSFANTDGVVYFDGTILNSTAIGSATQVLTSNGAGAPTFQALASPTGYTSASVTLTSAQIKALYGTPITIVAAPSSGTTLIPFMTMTKMTYGGTNAFTGTNLLYLYYGSPSGIEALALITAAGINATASEYFWNITSPVNTGSGGAYSGMNGTALVVSTSTSTPIGGNAAGNNTIEVIVYYIAVTI